MFNFGSTTSTAWGIELEHITTSDNLWHEAATFSRIVPEHEARSLHKLTELHGTQLKNKNEASDLCQHAIQAGQSFDVLKTMYKVDCVAGLITDRIR